MKKILCFIVVLVALLCSPVSAEDGCETPQGRFETRYQTVLVCAPRCERVWVDPIYQGQRILQVGYWRDVVIPAVYERRLVQVWIPERNRHGSFDLHINWNWRTW